jgi:hypothetical protein
MSDAARKGLSTARLQQFKQRRFSAISPGDGQKSIVKTALLGVDCTLNAMVEFAALIVRRH